MLCSCKKKKTGAEAERLEVPKTVVTKENRLPVSEGFLRLMEQFDSAGFGPDVANSTWPQIIVGNLILLQVPPDNNSIQDAYTRLMEDEGWRESMGIMPFKIKPFQKVLRISRFQYKQRVPRIDEGGLKWYTSGWVEEWEFTNKTEAQQAFSEMPMCSEALFFKTGGFACLKDRHMYLFSSRSTGFVYEQKPFFKRFVKEIKADGTFSTIS